MTRKFLAASVAAAALALGSMPAGAAATFGLEIRGTGQYFDYFTQPQPNGNPYWPVYWMGSMTVTTDSTADGIYSGADLLAVDFNSNYAGPSSYRYGDGLTTNTTEFGTFTSGMAPDASVTLSGGRVVSVDFHYLWEYGAGITASGSTISTEGMPFYSPHGTDSQLTGTALQIPEPPPVALLLAGVVVLMAGTTRRGGRRERRTPPAR